MTESPDWSDEYSRCSMMDSFKIHALVVVDDDYRVVGALNVHDLFRARVV